MKPRMIRILLAVALLGGVLQTPSAWAGSRCGPITGQLVSLGQYGSLDIETRHTNVDAPGGLYCNRDGFAIYGQDWIRVRLEDDAGGRLVNQATGDSVRYSIYTFGDWQPLVIGRDLDLTQFKWIGGTADALDVPLFFQTEPTLDSIPAGTYTAAVRLRWFWQICPGTQVAKSCLAWGGWDRSKGLRGLCLTGCSGVLNWGEGEVATLTLRLIVTNQCEMVTPDLNFGSAALVSGFSPTIGSVQVRCSKNASYTVGMSLGSNPDGTQRRMRNGNQYLAYELYKSTSGNDRWGDQGSERRTSDEAEVNPGVLDGRTEQIFNYRGVILPDQPTPPAAVYTDNVQVDVKF
ncbi:Csu type fimbrial protein [Billgrantia endophytica]|uniref:Spore coat protein U/FanG domain-containing protein n=1 Tax=Billgrantia endophytica TaxID=2033802 RepID=A0A2N7U0N5_9GAMM|nr:spore coat U domain-containing protein [Halomonas endophytica]PMR73990.1 hypothetical protein C1H69_15060 [Halomonas endophytica]